MKTASQNSSAPILDLDDTATPVDVSSDAESLRQAMALAWLAQSNPLAAPADSLGCLQQRLNLTPPASKTTTAWKWQLTALIGWGSAAALAVMLMLPSRKTASTSIHSPSQQTVAAHTNMDANISEKTAPVTPAEPQPGLTAIEDPAVLRHEIAALRDRLQHGKPTQNGTHQAVVFELRPPGSAAPTVSSDHLLETIATALEADLSRRKLSADDEVIIERGWAKWSAADAKPATIYRHRAFPVERATELGLQAGPDGQFLDPNTGWLWQPDALTGDYIGKIAPVELDQKGFTPQLEVKQQEVAMAAPVSAPTTTNKVEPTVATADPPAPEGFLVGTGGGRSIVTLNNMPPISSDQNLQLVLQPTSGDAQYFSVTPTLNGTFTAVVPVDAFHITDLSVRSIDATAQVNVIMQSTNSAMPSSTR